MTCGTADKRAFLLEAFPTLRADHIGDSRSCSFEETVKRQTAGKGVHLALNSLADDKLQVRRLRVWHMSPPMNGTVQSFSNLGAQSARSMQYLHGSKSSCGAVCKSDVCCHSILLLAECQQ